MTLLNQRNIATLVVLAVVSSIFAGDTLGAITAEQQQELREVSIALNKANSLFGRDQFVQSAEGIAELHERFEKLAESDDADLQRALQDLHKRFIRTHALLELEGVELPPLPELKAPTPTPTPSAAMGSSFVKDVAPMLVAKCGNCHVDASRGQFNMSNYDALMQGSAAGVVIFPGDPSGSAIVEVIESGDMPRGGRKVTPEELTSLKAWIAAGAKFDGDNRQEDLNTFAAASGNSPTPTPTATAPTGNETVSFARDIAPVLATSCFGCHVNAQNARGNLNMTTFDRMLRGGDSGTLFIARQPMNSLIIARIKGEGGETRMPMGREPLSDAVIAQFEKWIAEGARFDGPNTNMDVVRIAALSKAANSTHEQLTADRKELALQNWNLGMAGTKGDEVETKNFFVVGNVGSETLEEFGERAEELTPRVAPMFGAPSNEPLIKGRMSLFLFKQRYDYSEFGQMVEKRELPKEWRGHWKFDVVDAYGALIPPSDDSYTLDGLIAQQLAGTYVASLGSPPRWFSEGCARVAASKIAARDPRVVAWKSGLRPAIAKMNKPDDFMTGKLPPEDADIASYAFVTGLMKDSKKFDAILDGLRAGEDFQKVFINTYGLPANKVAEIWLRTAGR